MSTKPAHVREMFGSIATRYDLANHVLSCGIDFYWRARAAQIVHGWHPHTIADLATGTGDLALAMQEKLPHAELTGVDFLPEMLELARRKGVRRVVLADAMKLPLRDRVQLAQRLVSTIDDEVETETEALWFAEAERRLEELRSGKVQGISAEDSFRNAREALRR